MTALLVLPNDCNVNVELNAMLGYCLDCAASVNFFNAGMAPLAT